MAEDIVYIPQGKLNGIQTLWMINQSKLVVNKELLPLWIFHAIGMYRWIDVFGTSTHPNRQGFTNLSKVSAVREKVIHGVDHNVDFPSIYDVEDMDVSNNQTIIAVNESTYNPTIQELDVKPPATKKAQDVLLEDLATSSTMLPPTATNRFGISEQVPVSQDVNNIHVFNDNDKSTSQENKEEEHPKVMEISVANQLTDTAMESELVSRTTTEMVNLDHTKEFQECMDIYEIGNGEHLFNMIALAIAFYKSIRKICLVVTTSSACVTEKYP